MSIDLEKNIIGEVEVSYSDLMDESRHVSKNQDKEEWADTYEESEHRLMQLLLAKAYAKITTRVLLLPDEVRYDEYNRRLKLIYKAVPISA